MKKIFLALVYLVLCVSLNAQSKKPTIGRETNAITRISEAFTTTGKDSIIDTKVAIIDPNVRIGNGKTWFNKVTGTRYVYDSLTNTYFSDIIYGSSTPTATYSNGSTTIDNRKAIWKNSGISTNTVDFSYQVNKWFPVKGFLSPFDFDAKADNSTDDLTALRNFLKHSTYPIRWVPGNYKISDTLGVAQSLNMVGSGVKITVSANDKPVFKVLADNVRIYNFDLVGTLTDSDANPYNNFAIVGGGNNLIIENNIIHNWYGGGMYLTNAPNSIIKDNLLYGNTSGVFTGEGTDIYLWTGCQNPTVENNRCFSNSSQGIFNLVAGTELKINNNNCTPKDPITFADMDTTLIYRRHGILVNYNAGQVKNCNISGNIVKNTRWTGIYLTGTDSIENVIITGNVLHSNGISQGNSLSGGIAVFGTPKSLRIANNTIFGFRNQTAAVGGITYAPTNLSSTYADSSFVSIVSNTIDYCYRGMYLTGRATNMDVKNNDIRNSTLHGVYVSPVAGLTYVSGGTISGNTFSSVFGTTSFLTVDFQSSTKYWNISGNTFRNFGTTKNTGISLISPAKSKIFSNYFENLTTGVYCSNYVTSTYENAMDNSFLNCTNAYDLSTTALGNGYYFVKNDLYENVTNIGNSTLGFQGVFNKNYYEQTITSGITATQLQSATVITVNPSTALASLVITLKTSPTKGDMLTVKFGGTIASGATVVTGATSFTGGTVYGNTIPTGITGGAEITLYYDGTRWRYKYVA